MYNCILIFGPTASGKSDIAIALAQRYGGEIINCDSQQIYKDLNIGTAKPTLDDFKKVKHHLFDYVSITEDYSVSRYNNDATMVFDNLQSKNVLPVFVGGTGLYIDSLLYKHDYGFTQKNNEIRQKYEEMALQHGNQYVYDILEKIDPVSAKNLHPNDLKRVVRALEIASTGKKKSEQILIANEVFVPFIIYTNIDRDVLYDRINKRVDIMVKNGLFEEVSNLHKHNLLRSDLKLPIGYSEWIKYYANELDFDQTIALIKQHSRNYAKRQITWFKRRNFAVEYNPMHSTIQDLFSQTDKYFLKSKKDN